MIDSKSTNQNASSAGGRSHKSATSRKTGFRADGFSLAPPPPAPPPPSPRFVTRPRPILARVQDGAGDSELRVLRDFFAIKTPTNRLQAG